MLVASANVAYSANEYRKILKSTSMVSGEGDRIEWSTTPPPKVVYHDDGDWRTERWSSWNES